MEIASREDARALDDLREAALDQRPVSGGVHEFYRYPARFAPAFARAAIEAFTDRGDLVFDPFVGGGTSLVEAQILGRRSIGFDINPLAIFVSSAKTTRYSQQAFRQIEAWRTQLPRLLNARRAAQIDDFWTDEGYLRNFVGTESWALRKLIAQALTSLEGLSVKPRLLARCALLRTAQWAIDLRDDLPSASEFRDNLDNNVLTMVVAAHQYRQRIFEVAPTPEDRASLTPIVAARGAEHSDSALYGYAEEAPKLILTSPPYPGVYVLYHRWKIHARRETPLPYWIANSLDGRGLSHYILGRRQQSGLPQYFENLKKCFTALKHIAGPQTLFVQIVGFSEPEWQLPRYLSVLDNLGLKELRFEGIATHKDLRLWREVPGRRWFATHQQSAVNTAREVVLFHRLNG